MPRVSSPRALFLLTLIAGCSYACASKHPVPSNPKAGTSTQGFTPLVASKDTVKIYVSAGGSDSNDGLSPDKPLQSIAAGIAKLRDNRPDWLLFKRGDSWTGGFGNWNLSGRSATEPMVVATYGSGARPLFRTGTDSGIDAIGSSGSARFHDHVWFVSLEFRANTRDPSDPDFTTNPIDAEGIHWRRGTTDLLFEDVVVRFYGSGATFQDSDSIGISGVKFRRCQFLDSYDIGDTHSQGIYVSGVTGMLFEENLFDHNGWNENVAGADKTIFNHNAYIDNGNKNVVVKNNIFLRASSHGIQLRPGGIADGNLFVYNALSLLIGGGNNPDQGGVDGEGKDNVIIEGTDIGSMPKQYGIDLSNAHSVVIANNVVANAASSEAHDPIALDVPGVKYSNNVVYNWPKGQNMDAPYVDPSRDLATYDATLGGPGTFEHLVQGLRDQGADHFRSEYTATAINAYIRDGFRMK